MLKGTSVFTFCGICATCKKGKLIGSGGNGRVYECSNIKGFLVKEADEENLKGEKNYIKLKNSNKYKHVAKLFLVPSNEKAIIIEKLNYILNDYLNNKDVDDIHSNLSNYIDIIVPQDKIRDNEQIVSKLIECTKFLHDSIKYCHHDIKPHNVGFNIDKNNEKIVKFIDMGNAKLIDDTKEGIVLDLLDYTMQYASFSTMNAIYTNQLRDNWAIACTIFEIIAGISLFHHKSKQHFLCLVTMICAFNTEEKIKYILGYRLNNEDGFPILSPYKNEKDIVSRHLHISRWLFNNHIKDYPNKEKIKDFLLKSFIQDVNFYNKNATFGGRTLNYPSSKNIILYNPNKTNPLLLKKHIYDYDENTGRIKIKNITEWRKAIAEIRNDIYIYENSEKYKEDKLKHYNVFQKEINPNNPEYISMRGGKTFVRYKISKKDYEKKSKSKEYNVSRHKLGNGKYVYYEKTIKE